MQKAEKRKKERIPSINLLNYVSLDQNYQEVGQGMGKTINLSETGVLIETSTAINPEHFLSLNIGLADEQFKVHGQVVYTDFLTENHYRTGIRFNQAPRAGYYIFKNMLTSLQNCLKTGTNIIETSNHATMIPPRIKGPKSEYLYIVDEETYLRGEKIITQGNFGTWVWVILDGWANVVRETPDANFDIFKIGPGGFIGSSMSYLTTNHARTNSIIASETVQLGLLDSQQMIAEHAALSPVFREILISLSGRLKRLIDRITLLKQGNLKLKEDLLKGKIIFNPNPKDFSLYNIIRGKATMLHRSAISEIPLINLYPGDYLGALPFLKNYNELDFCVARASSNFEKKELNRGSLLKEYENLSQTLKNMIEFTSLKLAAGSQILEQIMIKKSQLH
ncbi:MAG: cyclic nucleotide-binding domain-containing protein [Desulfobacteraceae bacterium]